MHAGVRRVDHEKERLGESAAEVQVQQGEEEELWGEEEGDGGRVAFTEVKGG